MEVHVTPKDKSQETPGEHNSDVAFLYNVKPGRSRMSYATQCAAMNGIPSRVVERACQLNALALAGQDLASICSGVTEEELEPLAEAEAVTRAFLSLNLHDLTPDQVVNFKDIWGNLFADNSSYAYSATTKSLTKSPKRASPEAMDES